MTGKGVWKVSASTAVGQELVLRTRMTPTFAKDLAAEATACLLTMRMGREYPDDAIREPVLAPRPAPEQPQGVTVEMLSERIRYMENDGSAPRPADTKASRNSSQRHQLSVIAEASLKEIAAEGMIPTGAWERLGAKRAGPTVHRKEVFWRKLGMTSSGVRHKYSAIHMMSDNPGATLCGAQIPNPDQYKIRDKRGGRLPGNVKTCTRCHALAAVSK